MAQFMLLLHAQQSDPDEYSPEEVQAVVEKYRAWSQEMGAAGKLAGGNKLTADTGKILRGDKDVTVVDGPFSETKEVIGGYFIVEAASYDEAAAMSKSCPHLAFGGTIELRQIDGA